jgi:hypothetical protein
MGNELLVPVKPKVKTRLQLLLKPGFAPKTLSWENLWR